MFYVSSDANHYWRHAISGIDIQLLLSNKYNLLTSDFQRPFSPFPNCANTEFIYFG